MSTNNEEWDISIIHVAACPNFFQQGSKMEFYGLADWQTTEQEIQQKVRLDNMPDLCESIYYLMESQGDLCKFDTFWGQFHLRREKINGGVRFTMPDCPNGLSLTITTGYPPDPQKVFVHCTINRLEHDPNFIETLEDFVKNWIAGLEKHAGRKTSSEQDPRDASKDDKPLKVLPMFTP